MGEPDAAKGRGVHFRKREEPIYLSIKFEILSSNSLLLSKISAMLFIGIGLLLLMILVGNFIIAKTECLYHFYLRSN